MNRVIVALSVSVLLSAAVLAYVLRQEPPSAERSNTARLESRMEDIEQQLSSLAKSLEESSQSTGRPSTREGEVVLQGDGVDRLASGPTQVVAAPAEVVARLAAIEARLQGLEGDPVHRALSYVGSGNPELRRQGVESLAALAKSDPDARDALFDMLKDDDSSVRLSALKALSDLESKDVAPMAAALLEDESAEVRREAIRALTRLGDTSAAAEIASYLDDESDEVRRQAAEAMGKLGYGDSASALLRALEDPSIGVRGEAIASLGELGAKESLPRLRELYTAQEDGEHRDADHRVRIAMAMKQLGDNSAVEAEIKRLGNMVHYDDHPGAMRALMYIGRGEASARAYFARAAEASNTEWIRREAKRMLEPESPEKRD